MIKIILTSILLTLVFSWEECKRAFRTVIFGLLRRRDPKKFYSQHLDRFVGTLILLATIPLGLTYFLLSSGNFFHRLWVLALQLLVVSLVATGSEKFVFWITESKKTQGHEKTIPIIFAILEFFSPIFHPFSGLDGQQRKILASFAFWLSLPPLAGLLLGLIHGEVTKNGGLPQIDAGIALLVGSLFIRITVDFLEAAFRLYALEKVFAYYRMLLGIVLIALMLFGNV